MASSYTKPQTLSKKGTSLVDRVNLFFHFRRYFKMVGRRWFVVALACAIGTGYMTYQALTTPDVFRAHSKIGFAPQLQAPRQDGVTVLQEQNFYDTQREYMNGAVLRRTRAHLGQQSPEIVQSIMAAGATKERGYFLMTVEATRLDFARQFAQKWAEEFKTFRIESTESFLNDQAAGVREELLRRERELARIQQELLDFRKKHNIIGTETVDPSEQRLERLKEEYHQIATLKQRLENQTKEDLANGAILIDPSADGDAVVEPGKVEGSDDQPRRRANELANSMQKFASGSHYREAKRQLIEKEAEYERLRKTLKPAHPVMAMLNEEIAKLQRQIDFELQLIEEQRVAHIKQLEVEERALKPIIDQLSEIVFASKQTQIEHQRRVDAEREAKEAWRRANETLSSILRTAREERDKIFTIMEAGVGPALPVRPDRPRMIAVGLLFSLAVGLAIVYFLDKLDDRLELAEEIQAHLGLPVLGQIPEVPANTVQDGRLLMTEMDDHSMFAESVRGVRSAVTLGSLGGRHRVITVTSAVPEDGKTTFTANFAVTLAIAGHRVLLIDADLRRGNLYNYFKHSREPGLAEILSGKDHWLDVINESNVETLQIIHCGKPPANPGELLFGPVLQEFIQEARKEFDYIILDCPPLTAIDDTFTIAPHCDGVLFVVRSGQTSMRFAKNALSVLRQRNAPVLGVILNGITPDNPYYYYQNYYHGYYTRTDPDSASAVAVTSTPAVKMAPPRRRSAPPGSIIAEARRFEKKDRPTDEA